VLLVFSLDHFAALIFISRNLFNLLVGFFHDLCFVKSNFFDIEIMLKLEDDLHVVSLELKKVFILSICDHEHFVLLPLYLLLEIDIVIGCFHKTDSQVSWDDDIHNVNLLYDHSINLKLLN
jgi:hypothetical protein